MQTETRNTQIEEDEIDLRELFSTILKYKFKIAIFVSIITSLTLIYALSLPNKYKSELILAPQEQGRANMGGGLAALAGFAGVDVGGGSLDVFTSIYATLKDKTFNTMIITKYNLNELITPGMMRKNMVFALNISEVYDFLNSDSNLGEKEFLKDEMIFNTQKSLQNILKISSDKKTGLITLNATTHDRFLSKKLVDIYLKELAVWLREREMKEVKSKIAFYKHELANISDIELKTQLSQILSGLVQKRVLSQASEFYVVSKVTDSTVAYIKDKEGPKRALILIVSMITSLILAIFGIFMIEFFKNDD
jgi:uncharacterized protein involved in exopolysaccharide biosynthesis